VLRRAGILSVAFHPFARNGKYYVCYTDRVATRGRHTAAAVDSGNDVLGRPIPNHNGGQNAFGADVYVGMGDAGGRRSRIGRRTSARRSACSPRRPERRGGRSWVTASATWRFSFDRASGDLYIGDVGQGDLEEINWVPGSSSGLENYGWDVYEGRSRFEDKPSGPGNSSASSSTARRRSSPSAAASSPRERRPRREGTAARDNCW
jgi:hypothetical protein